MGREESPRHDRSRALGKVVNPLHVLLSGWPVGSPHRGVAVPEASITEAVDDSERSVSAVVG